MPPTPVLETLKLQVFVLFLQGPQSRDTMATEGAQKVSPWASGCIFGSKMTSKMLFKITNNMT